MTLQDLTSALPQDLRLSGRTLAPNIRSLLQSQAITIDDSYNLVFIKQTKMDDHFKILSLGAAKKLPDPLDDTFEYSIDIVTELIDAGYLNALDVSSMGYDGYTNPKITLSGREYLKKLSFDCKEEEEKAPMTDTNLKLFISHSSKDVEFITKLVELIRSALNLRVEDIRCTSVDGYGLPGGTNTDEQLKQEVHSAEAFVGVISTASIQSIYVVFELGARWGAGKHLIPLLTLGTDTSVLGGPLGGITALRASKRAQLIRLVEELGKSLSIAPQPASSWSSHIEAILKLPVSTPSEQTEKVRTGPDPTNYKMVTNDRGATVYESIEGPQHYACPNCFPDINILQERGVAHGNYDCRNCKSTFLVGPDKTKKFVRR